MCDSSAPPPRRHRATLPVWQTVMDRDSVLSLGPSHGPCHGPSRSSSSRSGSPSVRRRPAGPQGPAERSSSSRSGSSSIRRRPAGPQGPAERGSSSRSGSPSCYAARRSPLRGKAGLASQDNYGPDREVDDSLGGPTAGAADQLDRTTRAASPRPHPNGTRRVMSEHDRVGSMAIRGYVPVEPATQCGGRAPARVTAI